MSESGRSIASRVDETLALPDSDIARSRNVFSLAWASLSAVSVFCTITGLLMVAWAVAPLAAGWQPTAIISNSMAPAIQRGDVVVLREHDPLDVLGEGAVVRFTDAAGRPTVHRIESANASTGSYVTKGDANAGVDSEGVAFADVSEVGALVVPLVGWPPTLATEGNYLALVMLFLGSISVMFIAVETLRSALRFSNHAQTRPLGSHHVSRHDVGLMPAHLLSRLDLPISTSGAGT